MMAAGVGRRDFLRGAALTLGGAAAAFAAIRGSRAKPPPDVLMIIVDDLNDWTGFLDTYPGIRTPAMDALAARGLSFQRAYAPAPACLPSRTSFLTGLRPTTLDVLDNTQNWLDRHAALVTLPDAFKAAGYHIAGAGKIFHNNQDFGRWDEYLPEQPNPRPAIPESPPTLPSGFPMQWGPLDAADAGMGDHRTTSWACDILERQRNKPLFLGVGLVKPHLPWFVPRQWYDLYPPETVRLPPNMLDDSPMPPSVIANLTRIEGLIPADDDWLRKHDARHMAVRAYLAAVSFVDSQIGRLLAVLDRHKAWDNTVVVLAGDNGFALGQRRLWRKFTLWRESLRVPFLIAAPGVTRPGTICDIPVNLLSLYPTLLDLAGLPARPDLEGPSLRPLLERPAAPWDEPSVSSYGFGNHSLRIGHMAYNRYADGAEELYDMAEDSAEAVNLAGRPDRAADKARLAARLDAVLGRKR